jgi:beta-lactamase regulating signal transducer with metallopeptidase domain/protocatechuate 3,4-dioxygenase beta subunit/5-hydroxyisourate hydrolase-like protein (transthyretin family)
MTAWMEPFAFWLADVYLAATILLLATAVIFALVKQPSLRMAVAWGIVPGLLLVAGFCLSPSRPHVGLRPARQIETNGPAQRSLTSRRLYAGGLQAALDAQSKTAGVKPAARTDDLPIGNTMEAVSVDESDRLQSERFEREPAAPIASSPVVTGVSESGRPSWAPRLVAGLVSVFLAGSLFVATWLVLGVWRASRLVRESEPAPQACLDELHALVRAPCRPPRLRVNRRLLTPVATGAVRPAILLPEESSRGGEPHALRAVLAHEWTHIKNGDLWLLALDRIVLSLLWAHPLYWWTRRRFRADQEFLADAAAAAQIGAADYAALLLHWARKVTEQRSLTALTAVGIWERPAGLTERVTTLLADSNRELVRTSGRTRVGVAAALALLSLAAATISLRPPQSQMARAELAQAELARAKDNSDTHSGPTVAPPAPATPIVQSPPENESPQSEPAQNTSDSNDVQGTCGDRLGKPLAGVQISLYAIQKANGRAQLLRQGTTDAEGRFRFPDCLGKKAVQLSWQLHDEDGAVFEVFARRADLGTGVKTINERGQYLDFTLTKAAPLTGTVRDRQGRPIAGALIRDMYWPLPKTGWLSAKSDAKGYFTIDDLTEYKYAGPKGSGPPLGLLSVEHPEYGTAEASYKRVPGYVEVVLGKAATIEGTVVNGETGKPAVGVSVFANWIDQPIPAVAVDLPHAQTDKNGHYQLRPLPEGLFNLDVSVEPINGIMSFEKRDTKFVAAPIEQFRTKEGQTATAPPIRLVKGGVVKGSLYQYRPGVKGVHDPVKLKEDEKLEIIVFYGPSLPNPGVVADMTFVRPDGTFELRLPPGLHYLSLPNSQKPDGSWRLAYSDMGEPCTEEDAAPPQLNNLHRIKIREGQTTEIELSVFRPLPPQKTMDEKNTQAEQPNATQLAEAPKPVDQRVDSGAIAGTFVDQRRAPVRGAEVLLFRTNWQEMTQQLVGQTSTDEAGRFEFNRSLAGRARKDNLTVVVRHEGLATLSVSGSQLGKSLDFVMPPAATLKGTVRDPAGKPVAGALVNFGSSQFVNFLPLPIEGIRCARTDAMGQFAVSDLEEFKYKPSVPPRNWHSGWSSLGPPSITIVHPDFARIWVKYFEVPGDVDVVLPDRAGTIEGQVVTAETGKPAAGVIVSVGFDRRSGIVREVTHEVTRTGPDGRYRVTSLPEESYGVWVSSSPTDQTAPVIESLAVHAGGTARAPVLRLVKGGVIEGRIVDEITGKHGAGITVDLQGVDQQKGKASSYFDQTVTDGNGHYRFASLPGGKFNLFVDDDTHLDAAAAAVDSFEIHAGQTATAPPIRLVRGGLIKGLIIDDATGKAVRLRAGDYLDIQSHGPARPRSGAAVQVAKIREDGTFEIRLPPGGSWLGVRNNRSIDITGDGGGEYSLSDGGVINVEYHVRRYDPSKESASNAAPVQQPLGEHEPYSTKITDYHIAKDEIGGMCLSRDEARLKGVEVALYIRSFGGQADNWGAKQIDKTTTNDEGQFVFRHVPQVDPRDVDYLMVARRHGRITMFGTIDHRHDWLDLRMPVARPFKGTVKNEQGKPVAGALVRCDGSPFYDLPEGIQSARTNARGEFEIDDVGGAGRCVVEHPDYARKTVEHLPFDEPAELKVRSGGVVEGQVVDTVTGKPASGLSVSIQPINQVPQLKLDDVSFFWASTKTDSQGLFRIESIPSGQFNVFVSSAPGRASVALNSLAVPAGEVVQAPPIRLVKPGVVKGRLIDELTGQPALVGDDERVTIGVHGPSRPRSGAAIEGFAVKADGTFELQLPPGRNSIYVSGGPFLVRKPGDPSANQDIRQIDVKEGTETTIEFRVIRQVPMKQAPEKTIEKARTPTSGAVQRPSQAPPIRVVKPGLVKGRLIDALTGQPALVGEDERVTIGVHSPSRPLSGAAIEAFQVKTDGTFELRLPPGKYFVYVAGGPFLVRKPDDPYANPDVTQVDVKEGTETTIEVRAIRQVPMKETPEKTINNPPAPTSGAVTRPAPAMVAEVPTVSPKIVDYHLEKDTVGGLCLGRDEARIAGVEVSLYIIGRNDDSHRYIGRTITNEEGQYVFQQVPQLRPREPRYLGNDEEYLMIARKKGLATALGTLRQRHDWLDLRMRPGVSMNGVVRDEQGHPVAGALVRGWTPPTYGVPEEAPSVRTNARGEFQIDDLEHFGAASVSHPDYMNAGFGKATKNPVVATLRKGSIVEGQVIDGETGKPVAEALVTMEPLGRFIGGFAPRDRRAGVGALEARTDANGRYRFRSLRPGTFWLSFRGGPGGVATAVLDELKVGRQQTVEVPPVRISKGATVMVRLISDDGRRHIAIEPIEPNEAIVIGIRSGAANLGADTKPRLETIHMRPDGTFAVWLPVGKHAISLNGGPFFSLGDMQQGIGHDLRQVDIKGGEDATVIFGVIGPVPKAPEMPMKNSPAPAGGAVNRPEPVMLAEAPTFSPKIVDGHLENDAVGGLCRGFDKSRLVGVEVSLYVIHHVQSEDRTHELIGRTITNDEGQFVFPHVPEVKLSLLHTAPGLILVI